MKILITTEQYYPVKSGVSTVVTSIAEELVRVGHSVFVATGFQNRKYLEHNGVKIFEFRVSGGFGNYYRGEINKYKEFVINFDCDVMINECVQTWSTDLILQDLQNMNAIKLLHSHGFSLLAYRTKNPWAYFKSKLYYMKLHKYLKNYQHIFLLHNKTVETPYLKKYGISHFSYLPNGVDGSFIVTQPHKQEKYILNISNYYPMKKQEFLLEAFYRSTTNYKLILIGSSILKNYLNTLKQLKKEFDQKYGFKDVEFLYDISREDTIKYLENAALFLHSSQLEVFPMVIVESMAKGIPYISTDVGNVKDLRGGVVINSINEMAKNIDILLTDSSIYKTLSKKGVEQVVKQLTWNRIVGELIKKCKKFL